MTVQTRTIATAYDGAASVTLQYDDATANDWLTAVIVTVDQAGRQWFASITDTANGHTVSTTRGAGTFAVPANQVSLAKLAGIVGPIAGDAGLCSRLAVSVRYPA